MKAKQCDRCKKFYSTGEEKKYKLVKVTNTTSRYTRSVDLCPKCENELQEWFKKGEKND